MTIMRSCKISTSFIVGSESPFSTDTAWFQLVARKLVYKHYTGYRLYNNVQITLLLSFDITQIFVNHLILFLR